MCLETLIISMQFSLTEGNVKPGVELAVNFCNPQRISQRVTTTICGFFELFWNANVDSVGGICFNLIVAF